MLFIKCVDLPHTIIDGFQKTVSHFSDILTLIPDVWLFLLLYVDSLDLKLNIFPQGNPGLFWKLVIFKILIEWHGL